MMNQNGSKIPDQKSDSPKEIALPAPPDLSKPIMKINSSLVQLNAIYEAVFKKALEFENEIAELTKTIAELKNQLMNVKES